MIAYFTSISFCRVFFVSEFFKKKKNTLELLRHVKQIEAAFKWLEYIAICNTNWIEPRAKPKLNEQ